MIERDGAAAIEVKVGTQLGYLWYSASSRISLSDLHLVAAFHASCGFFAFFLLDPPALPRFGLSTATSAE